MNQLWARRLWLLGALVCTLAACDSLTCDEEDPDASGMATFEGQAHSFDWGVGVLYLVGSPEDYCVSRVSISGRTAGAGLGIGARPIDPSDVGAGMVVTSVGFGGEYSTEDYGLYNDDLSNFTVSLDIDQVADMCARASATATGTDGSMYLSASEDWGPYSLDDVELSVDGQWKVVWLEDEDCS